MVNVPKLWLSTSGGLRASFGSLVFPAWETSLFRGEPFNVIKGTGFARDEQSGFLLFFSNGSPEANADLVILGDPKTQWEWFFGLHVCLQRFHFKCNA